MSYCNKNSDLPESKPLLIYDLGHIFYLEM